MNQEQILFRFHSDTFDREMIETIWAFTVDKEKGLYKLDNIPFYVPLISSGDIVIAEFDNQEKILTYRKTIEHSGNSTVQVFLLDESKDVSQIRDIFKRLGCPSEKGNELFFSMEIPAIVDYETVKRKLNELTKQKVIDYAELCLASEHRQ